MRRIRGSISGGTRLASSRSASRRSPRCLYLMRHSMLHWSPFCNCRVNWKMSQSSNSLSITGSALTDLCPETQSLHFARPLTLALLLPVSFVSVPAYAGTREYGLRSPWHRMIPDDSSQIFPDRLPIRPKGHSVGNVRWNRLLGHIH